MTRETNRKRGTGTVDGNGTKLKDLTEPEKAVLAVLAQDARDGPLSCRWALDRAGLRISRFHEAVKGLVDKGLVEELGDADDEEEPADQLVVTKQGKTFIQNHQEVLKVIQRALRHRYRNEVDREASSRRSSWTVRKILLGAAILLGVLSVAVAGVAWKIGGVATPTTPTAVAAISAKLDALKWLYMAGLVTIVGLVVIGGTFAKMNRGIRQQNLKAIGITLIAVLVVILALRHETMVEAAIGLLSAIAGYLFGKDSSSDDEATGTNTSG